MTDQEKKVFTKEEVTRHFAASGKVRVVFEKKDGSVRTMLCTRELDLIPKEFHRPTEEGVAKVKKTPDHLLSVFDIESNGWRSFTIAKVLSVEPV